MEDTNSSGMEIKYFKATSIHPPHYYKSLRQGAKIEERRADIDQQINSLLHNVHENLREQKFRKIAKRIMKASELKKENADKTINFG